MSAEIDVDALPPTQQLLLEVLAARARLGENAWTFPTRLRPALEALARAGLIWWKHGVIERTCLAGLTDEGRAYALSASYSVPATIEVEWGVRHGFGDDEKVSNLGNSAESRTVSRMLAVDYASAGQGGKPVCRRVISERWTEYPDDWEGTPDAR